MKLLINFAFLVFQTSSLVPETQDPILGQIRSAGAAEQLMNHMLKLIELLSAWSYGARWPQGGPRGPGFCSATFGKANHKSIFGGVCTRS